MKQIILPFFWIMEPYIKSWTDPIYLSWLWTSLLISQLCKHQWFPICQCNHTLSSHEEDNGCRGGLTRTFCFLPYPLCWRPGMIKQTFVKTAAWKDDKRVPLVLQLAFNKKKKIQNLILLQFLWSFTSNLFHKVLIFINILFNEMYFLGYPSTKPSTQEETISWGLGFFFKFMQWNLTLGCSWIKNWIICGVIVWPEGPSEINGLMIYFKSDFVTMEIVIVACHTIW